VAIVALLLLRPAGNVSVGGENNKPKEAKLKDLPAGETLTAEAAATSGVKAREPEKAIDRERMVQSYPAGRQFKIVVKGTMKSQASAKDWGIETAMNLNYAAEAEIIRTIEQNDGNRLVETREFRACRNLGVFGEVEDVRIVPGRLGDLILEALDTYNVTPGVLSSLSGVSLQPLLNKIPGFQDFMDNKAKAFIQVHTLQGKKVRIVYENGKGVRSLDSVGCVLTGEDQAFLLQTAALSDVYLLPNLKCKPGEVWKVQGQDLLPIFDASLGAVMTGELAARRGEDRGDADDAQATISLDDGVLDLHKEDERSVTVARWAPRGDLIYSFKDQMVSQAKMTGALSMETRSTDHILFEAKQTVRPEYVVTYSCELLK
jgi:hypothetical protein